MATIVVMPRFGATMEEGIVSFWVVKEGDSVSKGDLLGEIEIEKLTNELLAEEDGVILRIIAEEGSAIPCGQPILIIGKPGEVIDNEPSKEPVQESDQNQITNVDSSTSEKIQIPTNQSLPGGVVTPKAQELAEELGIDPSTVVGTGRLGMITREDIRRAYDAKTTHPVPTVMQALPSNSPRKLSQMEQTIAHAMEHSLRSTAQTTLTMDLDASNLVAYHERLKQSSGGLAKQPTYTAIFIKIVAQALQQHPRLRSVIQANQLVTKDEINIGVAIDLEDGLVVATIKNANLKSISQINNELEGLIQKVKKNALTNEDITEGVFTITNLGIFGVKYFTPILNPGETAILGLGVLQESALIVNGGIFLKPIFPLSLTHDHRVVNGAPAARFLQTIQSIVNSLD
jgi:pyruvate dehydrogenase E2 component (dihydrolipoamide acetyltransferase)